MKPWTITWSAMYYDWAESVVASQCLTKIKASRALLPASWWFLAWLILGTWRWRQHVSPERRLAFKRLHSITSQKIELSITTALGTWNSTLSDIISKFCIIAMLVISYAGTRKYRSKWAGVFMNLPALDFKYLLQFVRFQHGTEK
jgi:hypothetical protein